MKIAQICTNVMSGSVGSIVRNLYEGIKEQGDECLICYGRGKIPEGYKYYKFNTSLDIYYHVIMARLFDSDGLHSKMATKRLIKRLKDYAPDIVHIHCLHGYYINYPLLFEYFKQSKVKVVWTMHDCWAFTGHCCYYDFNKCDKWKYGCIECHHKSSYPKSNFISNSTRNHLKKRNCFQSINNLKIVTPSKWLKSEIRKSFLKNVECEVINNGININLFRHDKSINKEKIILGVASIWDERKGLDDFIKLRKILSSDYRIRVIGASKTQISILEDNNIEAIERTNSLEELIKEYNMASVLFNPTYEDNYPTVNLEALACGIPVITYDTGGSAELLKKINLEKLVVKKGDVQKVTQIILDLKNNKANIIKNNQLSLLDQKCLFIKYLEIYHGDKLYE